MTLESYMLILVVSVIGDSFSRGAEVEVTSPAALLCTLLLPPYGTPPFRPRSPRDQKDL